MKNLIRFLSFLALTLLFVQPMQAQTASGTTLPLVAGDTVANAGTVTKTIRVTAGYEGAALQVVLTRLTGTAAGTAQVYGSVDGTNYATIGSAFTLTNVASQTSIFYVTAPLPVYLRIVTTGSGTQSTVQRVSYVLRRHD